MLILHYILFAIKIMELAGCVSKNYSENNWINTEQYDPEMYKEISKSITELIKKMSNM